MMHCVIQCYQAKAEHFIWQVTNSSRVGWCFPAWHKCAPLQNAASWAFWCGCVLTWAPQHVLDLSVSLSLGHLNVLLCYGFHWRLLDLLLRWPANNTPTHAHNNHFYIHLSLEYKTTWHSPSADGSDGIAHWSILFGHVQNYFQCSCLRTDKHQHKHRTNRSYVWRIAKWWE